MKHKEKILSVFGDVNSELDTTDMSDKESLNIEEIENSIMNKLETMIDDKLKPNDATLDETLESNTESNLESTELNNEEDSNDEN